jgi:hypothetical protein
MVDKNSNEFEFAEHRGPREPYNDYQIRHKPDSELTSAEFLAKTEGRLQEYRRGRDYSRGRIADQDRRKYDYEAFLYFEDVRARDDERYRLQKTSETETRKETTQRPEQLERQAAPEARLAPPA